MLGLKLACSFPEKEASALSSAQNHCDFSVYPVEGTAIQMGGVLPYKFNLEVYCSTFFETDRGSGKEKGHKHEQFCPAIAWVSGGLPTGWPGVKCFALCAEPKEHKDFRPGTRPGGSVTGVTEKLFMCQLSVCLFWSLKSLRFFLSYFLLAIFLQNSR